MTAWRKTQGETNVCLVQASKKKNQRKRTKFNSENVYFICVFGEEMYLPQPVKR